MVLGKEAAPFSGGGTGLNLHNLPQLSQFLDLLDGPELCWSRGCLADLMHSACSLPGSTWSRSTPRDPFRCPGMRLLRLHCDGPATTSAPTPAASAGVAAAAAPGTWGENAAGRAKRREGGPTLRAVIIHSFTCLSSINLSTVFLYCLCVCVFISS